MCEGPSRPSLPACPCLPACAPTVPPSRELARLLAHVSDPPLPLPHPLGSLLVISDPHCTHTHTTHPHLQSVLAEAVEEFIHQGAAPAEGMIRNLVCVWGG